LGKRNQSRETRLENRPGRIHPGNLVPDSGNAKKGKAKKRIPPEPWKPALGGGGNVASGWEGLGEGVRHREGEFIK